MLDNLNFDKILFLDIETVPLIYNYSELNSNEKKLWDKKSISQQRNNETPEQTYAKAGIFAEFAKVICISVGILVKEKEHFQFRLKSFYGDDEKIILKDFAELLNKKFNRKDILLCAHNGKEFDFPFLSRRMLVNGVKLPKVLNNAGKKPWEVNHLDTMELWRFGDYKNFTSLDLLAHLFKIPTPKDVMDGTDVKKVYYEEKNLEKIVEYCQKDVLTVARLLLKYATIEDEILEKHITILK